MASQCVDGNRQPLKYLRESTNKTAKVGLGRGVPALHQTQHQQGDLLNAADYGTDPFEELFDQMIDSNFFHTERLSFKCTDQDPGDLIVAENDSCVSPFPNAEHSTWTDISSSSSGDSEVGTPYQAQENSLENSLAHLNEYTRDELYFGFSISSGWSSTFFPHGDER
ncbi:hypothetical protein N7457_005428 [Penicillium paradoxum]|uniref:uncharacterized protein n=1 Tax=Penicillium paradoxum TaxID=176176 RepID=UPI0025476A6B|nr:uncharacterized protein N7457_005428 [Penicillium paradoxum]KAJ5780268.1 hypothetical protein N7457_005428 [Penicillium paradoxum]